MNSDGILSELANLRRGLAGPGRDICAQAISEIDQRDKLLLAANAEVTRLGGLVKSASKLLCDATDPEVPEEEWDEKRTEWLHDYYDLD
jgi:hypothetical protein